MIHLAAAVLVLAFASSAAYADMNPAARTKYHAGNQLFAASRFSEALDEYQAAYKIDPDPDILFAIAQTERKLGRCHLALPHFREYLASRSDFPPEVQGPIADCWRRLPPPEANKPCPNAAGVEAIEVGLPWYKNPASGAVIVGTAGVAVGIAFLFVSNTTRDQAQSEQFSDDFDKKLDEATGQRRIGATFLVAGALLVGGGVAYHYLTRSRSSPKTSLVTDGRSIRFARSF